MSDDVEDVSSGEAQAVEQVVESDASPAQLEGLQGDSETIPEGDFVTVPLKIVREKRERVGRPRKERKSRAQEAPARMEATAAAAVAPELEPEPPPKPAQKPKEPKTPAEKAVNWGWLTHGTLAGRS